MRYFAQREIRWHDGIDGAPSNHLCCSQSCCVNFLLPFVRAPKELAAVLRKIGYDVEEVLPFCEDEPLDDGAPPYMVFEWIGTKNYLGEHRRGRVATDHDVHGVWSRLTSPDRFRGAHVEDLLPAVCSNAPTQDTAAYLQRRFGGMV